MKQILTKRQHVKEDMSIRNKLIATYLMVGLINIAVFSLLAYSVFYHSGGHHHQSHLPHIILVVSNLIFSIYFTIIVGRNFSRLKYEILELNLYRERQTNESAIQVLRAQEEEREKISFTLHDSVGQYLTIMRWGLSELKNHLNSENETIENLTRTCDDIIHEIRSISHDLMPTLIKDFGVCLAIKDYFQKQKQIVPLEINFQFSDDLEGTTFGKEFDVNLYRMIQEFFQNTLKHSGARNLKLTLQRRNDQLELNYYDDGMGMNSRTPLPSSLSYRAKLFAGEMTRVNYDRGLGFRVIFNLKEIGYETN